MQCTMKKYNECRKTSTSMWPSNSSTSWKQMTNSREPQGYRDWTYPTHLWGVRDMRSAHTREQDFMAITAKVEVLCQQLKGRGMCTVPFTTSTTSSSKTSGNVHFQPIDPAQKSSVQAMDQSLLNSSLNLLDDSP